MYKILAINDLRIMLSAGDHTIMDTGREGVVGEFGWELVQNVT